MKLKEGVWRPDQGRKDTRATQAAGRAVSGLRMGRLASARRHGTEVLPEAEPLPPRWKAVPAARAAAGCLCPPPWMGSQEAV